MRNIVGFYFEYLSSFNNRIQVKEREIVVIEIE